MSFDVHSHHWPDGLLRAVHAGRTWHGWEPVRNDDGTVALALGSRRLGFPVPNRDLADAADRKARRGARGVTQEAVMPVGFLWNHHLEGAQAAAACREINEELADAQNTDPLGLIGVGHLPFHAPSKFDDELAALVEMGLRAVALPASVRSANLDEPELLGLIRRVVSEGLVMILHPTYLNPPGGARLPRYYFINSIGASLECTVALMSLIHSGLLDDSEAVKLVVVQGGGSVPYEIGRFRLRYRERDDVRTMAESPDTYLGLVHYDCMVADDASLAFLVDRVGAEQVMIGTDHPFKSDMPQGAVEWVSNHTALSDIQRAAILESNARRLFAL